MTGVGTQPPPLVLGDVLFADGGYSGGYKALDAATRRGALSVPDHRARRSPARPRPATSSSPRTSRGVVRAFGPSYLGPASDETLDLP